MLGLPLQTPPPPNFFLFYPEPLEIPDSLTQMASPYPTHRSPLI